MATISSSTIEDTLSLFLRDVIRNNITDTQSPARSASTWVFNGVTEKKYDAPIIFIDRVRVTEETTNVRNNKYRYSFNAYINIWADRLGNDTTLGQQVRNILKNDSNTDGTNSIYSQNIVFDSIISNKRDVPVSMSNEPLKIRRVTEVILTGHYVGA
ncbi:MAG: hypothetical protein WC307_06680 [Candidatus Nanoarchaeia archaeon]|jgi:hypothetical protein